jgi:hypothetical protein
LLIQKTVRFAPRARRGARLCYLPLRRLVPGRVTREQRHAGRVHGAQQSGLFIVAARRLHEIGLADLSRRRALTSFALLYKRAGLDAQGAGCDVGAAHASRITVEMWYANCAPSFTLGRSDASSSSERVDSSCRLDPSRGDCRNRTDRFDTYLSRSRVFFDGRRGRLQMTLRPLPSR